MKSEPSCFSFEDLKASPGGTAHWDGVRNYQARNMMRDDMQIGDGVLFYHSSIKIPAIVGLAVVASAAYPDHTAWWDPASEHYDPKAGPDNPIWCMVDVRYVADLDLPLTREDLRAHPDLSDMGVLKKGNRLSVMPVTEAQWRAVVAIGIGEDPLEQQSAGEIS
jgi:predicted RNA-binding protein with PUA-like domain